MDDFQCFSDDVMMMMMVIMISVCFVKSDGRCMYAAKLVWERRIFYHPHAAHSFSTPIDSDHFPWRWIVSLLGMYLPKGSKCLYICIFSLFSQPVVCQINNSPRITVSGDASRIMSECYETTLVSCRVSWTVECAVAPILICDSANLAYVCVGEEASLASSFLRGVGR